MTRELVEKLAAEFGKYRGKDRIKSYDKKHDKGAEESGATYL